MAPSVNTKIAVIESQINDIHRMVCGGDQPGLMQKIDTHLIEYNTFLKNDASWKGQYEGSTKLMKFIFGGFGTLLTLMVGLLAYFK